MIRINFERDIPNHYAFTILLIISFLVAWYITSVADRIVKDLPNSEVLNIGRESGIR